MPIVQATMGIVQTWDTHVANFPRLKDDLLPPLDRAVSALLDDLEARGLLDETLVVMLGEFGRTPKITRADPGRRAGPRPLAEGLPGRLRRGRAWSAARSSASPTASAPIPLSRSFGPPDLAATIYHALGVDPATELRDRLGRPLRLCSGEVMTPLYTTAAV